MLSLALATPSLLLTFRTRINILNPVVSCLANCPTSNWRTTGQGQHWWHSGGFSNQLLHSPLLRKSTCIFSLLLYVLILRKIRHRRQEGFYFTYDGLKCIVHYHQGINQIPNPYVPAIRMMVTLAFGSRIVFRIVIYYLGLVFNIANYQNQLFWHSFRTYLLLYVKRRWRASKSHTCGICIGYPTILLHSNRWTFRSGHVLESHAPERNL